MENGWILPNDEVVKLIKVGYVINKGMRELSHTSVLLSLPCVYQTRCIRAPDLGPRFRGCSKNTFVADQFIYSFIFSENIFKILSIQNRARELSPEMEKRSSVPAMLV